MPESDARSVLYSFSDITNSSRVWRKVPESDARSVDCPFSGVTNSGRVWRKVPESDVRSVNHAQTYLTFAFRERVLSLLADRLFTCISFRVH